MERYNSKRGWFVNAWRIVDEQGVDLVQPWPNWLLRNLPGVVLRYCVGVLSDTSDGKEFRDAIDAAIERQGGE